MEHLLTNITGIDMALCLGLLVLYIWRDPSDENPRGLDKEAID